MNLRLVVATIVLFCVPGEASETCSTAKPNAPCLWTIQKETQASEGTITVRNQTPVKVEVKGTTPFDVCELTKERKEIEPERDALAAFLDVIINFGGALTFARQVETSLAVTCVLDDQGSLLCRRPDAKAPPVPPVPPGMGEFAKLLSAAHAEANRVSNGFETLKSAADGVSQTVSVLQTSPGGGATDPDAQKRYFQGTRNLIVKNIGELVSKRPSMDLLKLQIAELEKWRTDHATEFARLTPDQLEAISSQFGEIYDRYGHLQILLAQADTLIKESVAFSEKLRALDVVFDKVFPSYADSDAKVTLTVSCKDAIRGKTTLDNVYATLVYRNRPRLSLSLGLLGSTLDSVQIGKQDVSDGKEGSKTVFAETDRKGFQVVPFSFLNLRLPWKFGDLPWGLALHTTGGFGINPNTGKKEPEFFAGFSVGVSRVHLYWGLYFGRVQSLGGNFRLGDKVPENTTIPVNTDYSNRSAFGISYRLPIP